MIISIFRLDEEMIVIIGRVDMETADVDSQIVIEGDINVEVVCVRTIHNNQQSCDPRLVLASQGHGAD